MPHEPSPIFFFSHATTVTVLNHLLLYLTFVSVDIPHCVCCFHYSVERLHYVLVVDLTDLPIFPTDAALHHVTKFLEKIGLSFATVGNTFDLFLFKCKKNVSRV